MNIDNQMAEIRGWLELMESNLPRRVDAMISPGSKLPFKALVCREALVWRMAELSRGAFDSLEKDKMALGILATRAAVETSAALWYLRAKLAAAIKADDVGDIDVYLMRLVWGTRVKAHPNADPDPGMPEALNVMTFVDSVNKDVKSFRHQYEILSEYAHPNWAGAAFLYSKFDPSNYRTDFGPNIGSRGNSKRIGVRGLSIALKSFQVNYNRIADLMPAFVELCERHSKTDDVEKMAMV